ncbi:MATE family efflux transporter [Reinekea sp. G2M2-21]|uniref:MATE family efflux transporter n=1 Tax=Reinekea sp. G2M2-21 TaxID=2788942 RepID=UPI0018A946DA|nr:MATE family efflux transporter [Reinekea sp. G2M2-21]
MYLNRELIAKNASLAWPLAVNSILVQSMTLVDVLLIASLGDATISALGISTAIITFIIGFQYALASGTQLLLARFVGANQHREVAVHFLCGLLINGFFSFCVTAVLLTNLTQVLDVVLTEGAVRDEAFKYLFIVMWVLIPSSATQVMIVFFNARGETRVPLLGYLIEIPVNFTISLIFIYGLIGAPVLGLTGAAIGSVLGISVRLIFLSSRIMREKTRSVFYKVSALTLKTVRAHLVEVMPIAINFFMLSTGALLYQFLFAQRSVNEYAAIVLVFPWMQLGAQFVTAWALATSIHVSQMRGRNELSNIPEFTNQAIRFAMLLAVTLCFLYLLFSQLLPVFYSNLSTQTLISLASIAPVYILVPLVRTYNGLCGNTLRALGASSKVLAIHFVTQWIVALPLLTLLIFFNAKLSWVFSVILVEECLKVPIFRNSIKYKNEELSKS